MEFIGKLNMGQRSRFAKNRVLLGKARVRKELSDSSQNIKVIIDERPSNFTAANVIEVLNKTKSQKPSYERLVNSLSKS